MTEYVANPHDVSSYDFVIGDTVVNHNNGTEYKVKGRFERLKLWNSKTKSQIFVDDTIVKNNGYWEHKKDSPHR